MRLSRTLLAGAAAIALTTTGAQAADLLVNGYSPGYTTNNLFNFEGFYLGATGGVGAFPVTGSAWTVGLVAGANFALNDVILTGVEFQGESLWNAGGYAGMNALFLAKVGGFITDETIVYATGGGGWVDGATSYALGAGIEMAVAEQVSIRGEVMGTGAWGGWFNGAKATVGVLWHLN